MEPVSLEELQSMILAPNDFWISGPYRYPESNIPCIVVAALSHISIEVSCYTYSHYGYGYPWFIKHEKVLWPFGADQIFKYVNCGDGDELDFETTLDASSFPQLNLKAERRHRPSTELTDLTQELASILEKLDTFPETVDSGDDWTLSELEGLLEEYPELKNRPTPNFWS